MRRREFIAGLGSAAAWPIVVRAQQPTTLPVVGFINNGSLDSSAVTTKLKTLGVNSTVAPDKSAVSFRDPDGITVEIGA